MTSLRERIDIEFDRDDPPIDTVVIPGPKDSDVLTQRDIIAAPARQRRFATWIMNALGRVRAAFARPPRPARPAKRHYPPRFSLEFDTSLVDRERRRL